MPEATLGGETGVWLGKAELMSMADIATRIRNEQQEEKAPINWVEVTNSPRLVHVSEVPELWDALKERDLRLAQATSKSQSAITLLAGGACAIMLYSEQGVVSALPAFWMIESGEAWFEAAETRRMLLSNPESYFHRRSRECRYGHWVGIHPVAALWRTWSMTAAWLVLFVIQLCIGLGASVERAALVKPLVWEGEPWRLLTGAMLHGSIMHILMNAASAVSLALLVERTVHRHILVPLWLLGALGGGLASLLLMPGQASVGASGGLMGFVGFLLMMGWKRKELLPPRFAVNFLRSVVLMALMGILAWSVVDNAAHLGGLLTGAALGGWLFRGETGSLPLQDSNWRSASGWLGVLIFGMLFAFTAWRLMMHR